MGSPQLEAASRRSRSGTRVRGESSPYARRPVGIGPRPGLGSQDVCSHACVV